jgi:hypothetical protein
MLRAKNMPTNVSMEKRGGEISDMSEDSDAAKSARERYIRVAAMDIMASEGTWNIYVDKVTQYQLFRVVWGKRRTRSNTSGYGRRIKFSEKPLMNRLDGRNIYHLDPMKQTPATY